MKTIINANEAREITRNARANSYQRVMQQINDYAQMGLNEVPLIGIGMEISDVEKLIKAGFSVSTFQNQIDQLTFYKISW